MHFHHMEGPVTTTTTDLHNCSIPRSPMLLPLCSHSPTQYPRRGPNTWQPFLCSPCPSFSYFENVIEVYFFRLVFVHSAQCPCRPSKSLHVTGIVSSFCCGALQGTGAPHLLNCSSAKGHLDRFQFWAVTNQAAINYHVQIFVRT